MLKWVKNLEGFEFSEERSGAHIIMIMANFLKCQDIFWNHVGNTDNETPKWLWE